MRNAVLPAGTPAPDFSLPVTPDGRPVSLADLPAGPLVLAFYPADWSPVCGNQLALYSEAVGQLAAAGATLVGISVDGPWCHRAYALDHNLRVPLLADFEPKGGWPVLTAGTPPPPGFQGGRCSSSTPTGSSAGRTCRRPT